MFTPEVIPQKIIDSDCRYLNVDDAHHHIYSQLKRRGLVFDEIVSSLLPSNRRVPYIKTYKVEPDGTVITTCQGNRHKYPLCEYVVSDYRRRVHYRIEVLDKWLEDYVYPRCKPRAAA